MSRSEAASQPAASRLEKPLRAAPVTPLPDRLAVGRGTALFIDGRCSHPDRPIAELEVVVGDRPHPVTARDMPLPDAVDRNDHWWAIVPLEPVTARGPVRVSLRASLAGGGEATGDLGSIELLPSVETAANGRPAPTAEPAARTEDRPLIAICMATYDPPVALFERQIESIRAQSYSNWVCVLSDDQSPPEAVERMRQVLGDDPRFHLYPAPERLGFYRNFERALALAPAEASRIALCDQDDRWHPDKLEALSAELDAGAQLAYSDMRIVDTDGEPISETYWTHRRNNHKNMGSLLVANTVTGAASLFTREVLEYALPLPPRVGDAYHDHWIALVAMALGRISYVDRPLYEYVQHAGAAIGHAGANAGRQQRGPMAMLRAIVALRRAHARPFLRRLYFDRWCQTVLATVVLELRCGARMDPAKRRTVRSISDSLRGIAWLSLRSLRPFFGATETLGRERVLLGALAWRRLARRTARIASLPNSPQVEALQSALARPIERVMPSSGSSATGSSQSSGEWLTPLLVDYFARDGSTLMMRLLKSSPEIAVEDAYPFERKYFAYLWRWARLLDRGEPPEGEWGAVALGSLTQERTSPVMGPPPWHPRELIKSRGAEPRMSERAFELVWGEFSRRAARSARADSGDREARVAYYAEKHLNTWLVDLEDLPDVRLLALLRDPRDTFVSIDAFNRVRGTAAFGRERTGTDREHVAEVIARQRERLRWIAALLDEGEVPVIRYEELVLDLPSVARRLERWLGVRLDPEAAAADREVRDMHMSAESPEESVGRWKRELDPAVAEVFNTELRAELEALGFDV